MVRKANSEKKSWRWKPSFRPAVFTFSRELIVQISPFDLGVLCGILQKPDTASLKSACPIGERNGETEVTYQALDKKILPHITLNVFFENFSHPKILFENDDKISINATSGDPRLISSKITNFALWESDCGVDHINLCITVEAELRLSVVGGVDFENPFDCSDDEIEDQLAECENMFNIEFDSINFEEDDVLENSWVARFV